MGCLIRSIRIAVQSLFQSFGPRSNVFCRNESIAATVTEETLLQAIQDNRNADAYDRTARGPLHPFTLIFHLSSS
ncbi:hypothetical protein Pst134EB_030911 [Puccinia striiformis f. sp. tritici]|nr:hypothetical protein Pst134EB_030911 [Puccinia striiformis f. sp. tritici]